MNSKRKFWQYATFLVVVFLVFSPEMIHIGLFIDAVGLEMFILLLEIQALTILWAFVSRYIHPKTRNARQRIVARISKFSLHASVKALIKEGELILTPAPIMYLLVMSGAVNVTINVYQ